MNYDKNLLAENAETTANNILMARRRFLMQAGGGLTAIAGMSFLNPTNAAKLNENTASNFAESA
ncbi:MAG: hypothetical protein H7Z37_00580, partial [Pyrinomonadaceae bacterium]|nr:hypothetical protein [Pyrinomonadaceae bacterium]